MWIRLSGLNGVSEEARQENNGDRLGTLQDGRLRAARPVGSKVRKTNVPMPAGSHRPGKKRARQVLWRRCAPSIGCADKPVETVVLLRVARMGSRSTGDGSSATVPRPHPA